jgi:hypothetical protein
MSVDVLRQIPMDKYVVKTSGGTPSETTKIMSGMSRISKTCSCFENEVPDQKSILLVFTNQQMKREINVPSRCLILDSNEAKDLERISFQVEHSDDYDFDLFEPILGSGCDTSDLYDFDICGIF